MSETKYNDIMSVSYTETDNDIPALCICSDIVIPITNKTLVISFCNFIDNDLTFKISNLTINKLRFTLVEDQIIEIKAKVDNDFVLMGYVGLKELHACFMQIKEKLTEGYNGN